MLGRRAASSGGDGGKLTSIRRSLGSWRMRRGPVASGRAAAARGIVSACRSAAGVVQRAHAGVRDEEGSRPRGWRTTRLQGKEARWPEEPHAQSAQSCRARKPCARTYEPSRERVRLRHTSCACAKNTNAPKAPRALGSDCVFQRSLWPRAALHAPTSAAIIPLGASQRKRHRGPIEQ